MSLRRTPLYERHAELGAKLVHFAGWEMPVLYEGVREEHSAVRTHAGVFDVSHMGEVEVEGPGALAFLQRTLSNDVAAVAVGGAQYSCLCAEDGGVLDDLFAYRLGGDRYLIVTNSANHDADLAWLGRWSRGFDVAVRDVADRYAMLAVQGPHARAIVSPGAGDRAAGADAGRRGADRRPPGARLRHRLHRRGRGRAAARPRGRGRRSGPSCSTPASSPAGSAPATRCGSRPASTCTATTSGPTATRSRPGSAGAARRRPGSSAAEAVARARAEGTAERLAPFKIEGAGIPRQGNPAMVGDERVGTVTSGTFSPSLEVGIGMAYVRSDLAEPGTELEIDVRGKRRPARIASKPLYRKEK